MHAPMASTLLSTLDIRPMTNSGIAAYRRGQLRSRIVCSTGRPGLPPPSFLIRGVLMNTCCSFGEEDTIGVARRLAAQLTVLLAVQRAARSFGLCAVSRSAGAGFVFLATWFCALCVRVCIRLFVYSGDASRLNYIFGQSFT